MPQCLVRPMLASVAALLLGSSALQRVAPAIGQLAVDERIGALLRPGMQLVYESGGVGATWTLDSVAHDTTLGGRAGCVRMRVRTAADQAVPEVRAYCRDATTMFAWDERTGTHRPSRPLRGGDSLRSPQRNGGSALYETAAAIEEMIGARTITVVPTTVTTRDSTGTPVRRLRERFSIGLATATGGVFEERDLTQPGGWRIARSFELTLIRD